MSGSGMVADGDEASANPGVTRRRDDPNVRGELTTRKRTDEQYQYRSAEVGAGL